MFIPRKVSRPNDVTRRLAATLPEFVQQSTILQEDLKGKGKSTDGPPAASEELAGLVHLALSKHSIWLNPALISSDDGCTYNAQITWLSSSGLTVIARRAVGSPHPRIPGFRGHEGDTARGRDRSGDPNASTRRPRGSNFGLISAKVRLAYLRPSSRDNRWVRDSSERLAIRPFGHSSSRETGLGRQDRIPGPC